MTDRRNLNTALISSLILHVAILLFFVFLVQGGDIPKANHPITVQLITDTPVVIEEPVEVVEPVERVEQPVTSTPVEQPVTPPAVETAAASTPVASTPVVETPAASSTTAANTSSTVSESYPSSYDFGFEDTSAPEDAPVVVTPLGFNDASVTNTNTEAPSNDFFSNTDNAVFTDPATTVPGNQNTDSGFDTGVISDLSNKTDATANSNSSNTTSNTSSVTGIDSSNRQFQFVDGKSDRKLLSYSPAKMPDGLILDVPSVSVTYEFVILKDGSTSDLQLIGQTGYPSINSAVAESIRSMVFVAANSSDKRRVTFRILVEGNGN